MTDPNPPAADPTPPPYVAPAAGRTTKAPILSIISLVAGIIGILGAWIIVIPFVGSILGLPIPAAAVVLGFLGKKREPAAKGFWLTGIILGLVALALAVIVFIVWVVMFSSGAIPNYGY